MNAFCLGQGPKDNSCSSSKGSVTTKRGETLQPITRGKDKVWRNADGTPAPEHIQKLGIPPGWKDVVANPNPNGTLLAMGKDAKGRTQPKFSANHNATQAAAKFGRTRELMKKREKILKEVDTDAKKPDLKDKAECLKLVMQTGMRPGSDKDTLADFKSYGATTLEGRHVIDGGKALRLVTGKSKGTEKTFPISDPATQAMLRDRAKIAGTDGKLFATDSSQLRDYSKAKNGGGFRTKDFRTALGTETAIRAIKAVEVPTTKKAYKAALKEVATAVSNTLGNTPSIALKSYIDPLVFAHWRKAAHV